MQAEYYNAPGASHDAPSPLTQFGFLKNLEKKQTKDGQPAKRRGPKPDSKPALTRRQELNRQAQRTHRERKEMYIKALEQEVLRLKEVFTNTTKERDAVLEENRRLRELLASHGIQYDFAATPVKFQRDESAFGASSSGSISGSYAAGSESVGLSPQAHSHNGVSAATNGSSAAARGEQNMAQLPNTHLDYDEIGLDFVLTLERPCMDHMQYLLVRSFNNENQPVRHPLEPPDDAEHEHMSGHALMATAPPHSHIMDKPAETYQCRLPEINTDSLVKLLDLSNRLPFDQSTEMTPIQAWTRVLSDERLLELTEPDFEAIKSDLIVKVRCYGFGAVLEQFEVDDAIEAVFAKKEQGMR